MKARILMAAVSVAALLSAMPAHADTTESKINTNSRTETASPGKNDAAPMTKAETQKAWVKTKADVKEAVAEFKATVLGKGENASPEVRSVQLRTTAENIIGKTVYNQSNTKVAVVKDIIVDKDGTARLIVLKDGDFMNMGGKLAAFDYDMVIDQNREGDVIMPITEATIEKVSTFSYDRDDKTDAKTRVIPDAGYSIANLLDGNLVGSDGKKLASLDNVSFKGAQADLVFATHSQILHMGGEKVAINFDAATLTQDKDHKDVNLKLSPSETRQFENLKKSAAK